MIRIQIKLVNETKPSQFPLQFLSEYVRKDLTKIATQMGGRVDQEYDSGLFMSFSFPDTLKGEGMAAFFHDGLRGKGYGSKQSEFIISRGRVSY